VSVVQQKLSQAFALHTAGQIAKAEPLYREILQAEPKHFDALHMLGVVYLQSGRTAEALRLITKAVTLNPTATALNNQGNALQALERYEDALASYDKAVTAKPDYTEALKNRIAMLQALHRHSEAIAANDALIAVNPGNAEAYTNRGVSQHALGHYGEALASYEKALALNPRLAAALNNRGDALRMLGRLDEALESYARAVAIDPNLTQAVINSAGTLRALRRYDEALKAYDRVLSANPAHAGALSNRAIVLRDLLRYDEALACVDKAVKLDPKDCDAWVNRGSVLHEMNRDRDAVASFDKALALDAAHADAHWNKALSLLMMGDFAQGWKAFEWRRRRREAAAPRSFCAPIWSGDTVKGGALLVWGEQGVGDELFYSGMIGDLAARGMDICLEADKRLLPLFQRSYPAVTAIARSTSPDPAANDARIQAQISTASLGQYVRRAPSAFPTERRAYLQADAARAARYRAQLLTGGKTRLIGVSWVSKNPDFGIHKSSRLREWGPIWDAAGDHTQFVDLQYGDTTEERAATPLDLQHLDDLDLFNDLDGLAALITACDLVITVSNTTAHLAGALGVPVWVLVPAGNGTLWYWSPAVAPLWYPSARVFKQSRVNDWSDVIDRVAAEAAR